mmetsp:Transcript_55829/g.154585  ORF Transcript_55829/g.154585 Transcript_55829/m.154585 type:complete len:292 (+) Transcript_55829:107-982(+)|eukprot:CAMPEP_0179059818 /NCGR_PEP_ID=MMETSP0796-20121207/25549_1 /TAXON_ID=73915 /ORGANISM="Pyrodinium bahamense, Strain pbaha01" /LENGTH=291 /DNA_ID=CAMNT_0020756587 /DNA_START=105 /DNA_END=980 /DNA_ORIENTATION=-
MGKAKHKETNFSFVVDLKAVLGMKPEQRVKWLSKACRKVADGEANVKHVYDVLSSRKLVADMSEKVGRRMLRVLREHLYLFSEKQQRYLNEESSLAMSFNIDERSEEEAEEADDVARPSTRVDEAAARMEEMMARCRDFVREKASGFEQRRLEAEEAERQAVLAREREAAERLAREWDDIHKWHCQLEGWEQACMALWDERLQVHLQERSRVRESSESSQGRASDSGQWSRKEKGKRRRRERGRRRHQSSRSSSSRFGKDDPQALPEKRQRTEARFPTATLADLLRGNPSA